MSIYFRGGDYHQKGRGIGGFFRGLWNVIRPVARSVSSSVIKAAKSDTAKSIAKTLGEQALDSTLNMTKDMLAGNDLRASADREVGNLKRTGGDIISEIQTKRKRKQTGKGKRGIQKGKGRKSQKGAGAKKKGKGKAKKNQKGLGRKRGKKLVTLSHMHKYG